MRNRTSHHTSIRLPIFFTYHSPLSCTTVYLTLLVLAFLSFVFEVVVRLW